MKKISVAMATYNGEKYIKEQLESILKNLKSGDEIVISDDGSCDDTIKIIENMDFCGVEKKIVKGPGFGIKQNIGNAIKYATGDVIFLADQDDVWTDDKVLTVMPYFERGAHLVVHDAKVMNHDLTEAIMPSFFEYRGCGSGFLKNMIKNRYMGCCMAITSEVAKKIIPIPDNIEMHDWWIGVLCDIHYGDTYFIENKLLLYRRHEKNVSDFSHNSLPVMVKNRCVFLNEILKRGRIWNDTSD
ncbi:MAG: glycosyltransferase [Lachnospiraceae bacterium]|nr:glycosyltransferase [Lachnospiraceae bacterium]